MYYINNYRQEAINKIIPYLIEFSQVVKSIEISADRYQAIEDLLWKIADNFKLTESRGIFLSAHAHNENSNIIFTDRADDAFTYGTKIPEKQAYGTGHYYSQASYLTGSTKTVSEDKLIRAVQAKIIENNTNGTIEDLIQALKLYFNADSIGIYESYPLNVSIMIKGNNLELSGTGNADIIKSILPACVSLKNLYLNDEVYNIYQFSYQTSYGDSRYPHNITENVVSYPHYSQAITLHSEYSEYIETKHTEFFENMYCCFTGELNESYSGNILFSSKNLENNNNFYLNINSQLHFEIMYNNTAYNTDILAEAGIKYTFILFNSNNQLKLWIIPNVTITGENKDKDEAYITNNILNSTPTLIIDNFDTINNAPVYINGIKNSDGVVSGDFIYYAIVFGSILNDINDIFEYYITSYGQKQILFNCISNTNHLKIHSDDIFNPIQHTELITWQSDFKYAENHGNSKYAYFNGSSNIKYDTNKADIKYTQHNDEYVSNFKFNVSLAHPINLLESNIVSGFIYNDTFNSELHVSDTKSLVCTIPAFNTQTNQYEQFILTTPDNILFDNLFNDIIIEYVDNRIIIYNNNEIISQQSLNSKYKIVYKAPILNIGNHDFIGLVKNIDLSVQVGDDILNINIPSMYTLRDDTNNIPYSNEGVRIITTPQLMSDINKVDLYGNPLIGIR